jgi:hypothetical protein
MWVAFVDDENGMSRESWSVFYTKFFVADTQEKAYKKASDWVDANPTYFNDPAITVRQEGVD